MVEDHVHVRPPWRCRHIGNDDGHLQFAVVDLPAVGVDHQSERDDREAEDQAEVDLRRDVGAVGSPQLEGRHHSGQDQHDDGRHAPLVVEADRVLGELRGGGERFDRTDAAEIGREREQRQADEKDEAGANEALVGGAKSAEIEAEHKQESEGREHAHKYVQMRPRLRNNMHVRPPCAPDFCRF